MDVEKRRQLLAVVVLVSVGPSRSSRLPNKRKVVWGVGGQALGSHLPAKAQQCSVKFRGSNENRLALLRTPTPFSFSFSSIPSSSHELLFRLRVTAESVIDVCQGTKERQKDEALREPGAVRTPNTTRYDNGTRERQPRIEREMCDEQTQKLTKTNQLQPKTITGSFASQHERT